MKKRTTANDNNFIFDLISFVFNLGENSIGERTVSRDHICFGSSCLKFCVQYEVHLVGFDFGLCQCRKIDNSGITINKAHFVERSTGRCLAFPNQVSMKYPNICQLLINSQKTPRIISCLSFFNFV